METRTQLNPNESFHDLTLQNQLTLSRNQKVLANRIDHFETSFSTRLATVENSLSTTLSVLKEVLQRVRGQSPSNERPTPSPSPQPSPSKHDVRTIVEEEMASQEHPRKSPKDIATSSKTGEEEHAPEKSPYDES